MLLSAAQLGGCARPVRPDSPLHRPEQAARAWAPPSDSNDRPGLPPAASATATSSAFETRHLRVPLSMVVACALPWSSVLRMSMPPTSPTEQDARPTG